MANDTDINSLNVRDASDSDYFVGTVGGRASRVRIGNIKTAASNWSSIQNKPFDSIDADNFGITTDTFTGKSTLGISKSITDKVHSHTNKNVLDKFSENNETGVLLYNGLPVKITEIEWNNITDKPFESISEDYFTVDENELQLSENIRNELHTHLNKNIIDKFGINSDGKLLYDGQPIESGSGLDFDALSNSLTGGTLSGITITPNTADQTFNITVNADSIMQNISINDDGFWVINGEATNVSGKGTDGKNGKDGATPTINPTDYHWIIGETDTGITAKGADGYSPVVSLTDITNGVKVIVTNKDGTSQTADILNGSDGITPSINETTKHWTIGKTDTGILAEGKVTITADCAVVYANLPAANWSNTFPYSQTVVIASITSDNVPIVDLNLSSDSSLWKDEESAYSELIKVETNDQSITAYCKNKPPVDFSIKLRIAGDVTGKTFVTKSKFDELTNIVNSANASLENALNGGI